MLAKPPEGAKAEDLLMVDIGRPSFTTEGQAALWKKFHDWVEQTSTPIIVSGAFWNTVQMLAEGRFYMGSGFKYCFFFEFEQDKKVFEEYVAEFNKAWSELMSQEREDG